MVVMVVVAEKRKEEEEMEEAVEEEGWEKGGGAEEGKRGSYEYTPRRSFCFPPGDFGEFSRRRYYALFFLLPFIFRG